MIAGHCYYGLGEDPSEHRRDHAQLRDPSIEHRADALASRGPQPYAFLLPGSWRGLLRKELSSVFVQISLLAFGPSCKVRVRLG